MRLLLSVVGTRGDVQPAIALGVELRKLGHHVHLSIPPNFIDWAEKLGFATTSVGVEMRASRRGAVDTSTPAPPLPDLIADQFEKVARAANGCDIIVGANAHQYAAPSIAELLGIPYINAVYSPTAFPNDDNTRSWNERSLERVNTNRARLSLAPIKDVLRYVLTVHPWLAADPTLAPAPSIPGMTITQTGAWLLADSSALPSDLEEFLAAGEPPVYLGFGSMPVPDGTARTIIGAARSAGRRVILSRGWADLELIDQASDCIAIGDVNQQALFPRVGAVVHHGGAGTTLTAALAGTPQVAVPMFGDQPFWARRVVDLGIGASVPVAELSVDRLASALRTANEPNVGERARSIAKRIATDGAATAAKLLDRYVAS
jgi:vancomycin aglycone glucosyltransferase